MRGNTRRRLAIGLAMLALATGLGACGDDDDDDAATGTDTGAEGGGDLAVYCEKSIEIETAPEPEIDFETASEEEMAEGIKSYAGETLLPIADDIRANAPEEIEADIEVLYAAVEEVAETGDFEGAFETPEVESAEARVHEFDIEECGWSVVDVTAVDYEFQGIPETLEAGATSFEFTNEGAEMHELLLIRKNDDTTESFDELLALGQDEAQQKTTVEGATFAPPGESDPLIVDLRAGEYLAICFIPVGSVSEDAEAEGPPHFTQGMKTEFSVS